MPVLGRIPADVLHVFLDAGVLFAALLRGPGAAARLGAGRSIRTRSSAGCGSGNRALTASRPPAALAIGLDSDAGLEPSRSRRHFARADRAADRKVHAFARPHGRFDAGLFRVSARAAGAGVRRLHHLGALLIWRWKIAGAVAMMVLFFHAARLALVVFDPYLGLAASGRGPESRAARDADSG